MLKVVGASWLQTRISTYILIAVALLGVGAILLGEFGRNENDGTYSATVWWKHMSGYRIDFWGQGNELTGLPMGVARAYYRIGIMETGWSLLEIETSGDYPDDIQAYSAGLLEGSLTWQLIHHHWYNTVRAACAPRASLCKKMRRYLHENAIHARQNAALYRDKDPYWHMVHLFYSQLDGLEAGWKFAVRRSRRSFDISTDDFLWLALASDLPDLEMAHNGSYHASADGMIFLKALGREPFEPLIALAHNTAAPYARMLRLIKRYKFSYRVSPSEDAKNVPSRSIVMTSYPGALSSQDESYMIVGEDKELIVAGTPMTINNRSVWNRLGNKDQVMSPARIMAANRLATDGQSWSHLLARQNSGTSNRQWVAIESRTSKVWLVEQIPGKTHGADVTAEFREKGFLAYSGAPIFESIRNAIGNVERDESVLRVEIMSRLQENVTTIEEIKNLMRGCSREDATVDDSNIRKNSTSSDSSDASETSTEAGNIEQILAYRGDIDVDARPVGIIDSKIFVFDLDGMETFDATSGPSKRLTAAPFEWAKTFPNSSHFGHPEVFNFGSVSPKWIWV